MELIARQVLYLEISVLERDTELQARVGLDADVVKEYAEQMKASAAFPPVLVFARPGAHALVDGFHRVAARETLGYTTVLAEIRQGTREDALWHGLTTNQRHGLRRTNDDKHRSVVRALTHARGRNLSDRQIATHCGVHHYTVSRIRQQLEQQQMIEVQGTRVVTRGGVSYEQRLQKKRSEVATLVIPRLAQRLKRVPDASSSNERVRRLIQQAQSKLEEALDELSREQGGEERTLNRLFLHLTHLRKELSSAEERLLESGPQQKNGAQGY
jgi:DNA-binding transcriptional regulator YhcF (GntR family)